MGETSNKPDENQNVCPRRPFLLAVGLTVLGVGGFVIPLLKGLANYLLGGNKSFGIDGMEREQLFALQRQSRLAQLKLARLNTNKVQVADLSSLTDNEGRIVAGFHMEPVILVKTRENSCIARSAICTHLGCTVSTKLVDGKIFCPCHGSLFDIASGEPLAGPAQIPLEQKPLKIEDGKVYLLNFKDG